MNIANLSKQLAASRRCNNEYVVKVANLATKLEEARKCTKLVEMQEELPSVKSTEVVDAKVEVAAGQHVESGEVSFDLTMFNL